MQTTSARPVLGKSRLQALLGFLDRDPKNLPLLADAAAAAFDEKELDTAAGLLDRHAAIEALPPTLLNLKGMVLLAQQRYADAATVFGEVRAREDGPALRFNLAWAKAMTGTYADALALLDDETLPVSPRAPSLKIHMMHHLGLYDDALACGEQLAERFPNDQALMGALATLAMDAGNADLARQYAARGGKSVEASAALGFLALGDHDIRALALFDQAIAADPSNPRAWVGKGLGLLAAGDAANATDAIDRGAELFGDHIGSWIASGWAHFARGDSHKARHSFERALAIDPNFSECHGGLAVMDIMDGNPQSAQRNCDIALRLDKKSFGGALAKTLLLEKSGQAEMARRVRDIAFATPIGPRGETIAQMLAQMGSQLSR